MSRPIEWRGSDRQPVASPELLVANGVFLINRLHCVLFQFANSDCFCLNFNVEKITLVFYKDVKMKQIKWPLLMCFMAFNAVVLQTQADSSRATTPECLANGSCPCYRAKNCTDCYKIKICTSGWSGGPPAFLAGYKEHWCGTTPRPDALESWVPAHSCKILYVHKGWNFSYGVVNGGHWRTVEGGFPGDRCVVLGCYDQSKHCTHLENVGEIVFPGQDCTIETRVDAPRHGSLEIG